MLHMVSMPGMPSVHTGNCCSQLPTEGLAQTSSVITEVITELLPEVKILKVFANAVSWWGKNSLEADGVHLLRMEKGKSWHQPPQAPSSHARMWYGKGDTGICGIPAAGTSEVENKELQFHKGQRFVNRSEGFAELETKYLRKKTCKSKKLFQRFALGAVLATQG